MRKFRLKEGVTGWENTYRIGEVYPEDFISRECNYYHVGYHALEGKFASDWEEVFDEGFVRGEIVEVRDFDRSDWVERVYVTTIEGALSPYVCVIGDFDTNDVPFMVTGWMQVRKKVAPRKVTKEEIGKLLGTDNFEIV
jgi:hypothetical protein